MGADKLHDGDLPANVEVNHQAVVSASVTAAR